MGVGTLNVGGILGWYAAEGPSGLVRIETHVNLTSHPIIPGARFTKHDMSFHSVADDDRWQVDVLCLQDLESLLISDSSPKLFFSPEEVLVADGDSWEVDTLGVDNFHIHSPGVASQVDESLTHEPQEETAGQEHSYGPQHPARRHTMPCKTAHRLKQWNYPARKRTMDMFKHSLSLKLMVAKTTGEFSRV